MPIEKFYKSILIIYLSLISILSVYYLMGVNIVSTYNAMTEWVINYQGGFVRRGLIGEIIYQISKKKSCTRAEFAFAAGTASAAFLLAAGCFPCKIAR